ncbi:hypothetical protein K491DRAFT_290033 [Lophiostoma macrostomum CBS 122681]|uniref:Uncharacterized protein n=1 Tax=Lophiostoma macrostomum CBS 122681 TaxID=1314788 RepID=A0A6A6TEE0_9PLEO|nr:hypothetical protein K491DRAFT_290033 [Lophiostoma macrostomum CBS 122681]
MLPEPPLFFSSRSTHEHTNTHDNKHASKLNNGFPFLFYLKARAACLITAYGNMHMPSSSTAQKKVLIRHWVNKGPPRRRALEDELLFSVRTTHMQHYGRQPTVHPSMQKSRYTKSSKWFSGGKVKRKMTGKHPIVPRSEMLPKKEDQRKGSSTILHVPVEKSMEVGYMKG